MRKIKAMVLVFLIGGIGSSSFAQGMPVLDVANLMNAIEQLYQYYQQIQNTIEQVQNTYTQIEQAAQQMASMNWDDLKDLGSNFDGVGENPFEVITGVRNSAQDITKAVNKNMNKVNALQDSLTKESISFGGMKVSVADLCGAGEPGKNVLGFAKNAWNHTVDTSKEAVAGYVGKLSYAQKQKIMRQYGMSPKNYATLELANYQLSELVKDANVMGTVQGQKQLLEECENDANALATLAQNLPDGSVFAATQLVSSGLAQTERMMGNMHNSISKGFGMVSSYISSKMTEEAVKQQADYEKSEKFVEQSSTPEIYDDGL